MPNTEKNEQTEKGNQFSLWIIYLQQVEALSYRLIIKTYAFPVCGS